MTSRADPLELPRTAGRTVRATVSSYVALTKPRIIELLLVTTVPSMIVAAGGWPGTWLVVATLVGGTLCAASANTINNYLDRDIDQVMSRTVSRPLSQHAITPRAALTYGVVLGIVGAVWLAVLVNPLAAALATAAIVFYVFVYTIGMKRRTNQAVVIGGAAGCVPVLTGWAAVTGTLHAPAWALFAIIFYWTPPHFWTLAMKYHDDYAAAGVPMLPVTHGNRETSRHVLLYSYLLLAVTLAYYPIAQAGLVYLGGIAALDAGWLVLAHRLRRDPSIPNAMRLFHYSTAYLALVFTVAAVDALV
ncbi:MAG: heme o synthase [Actinomycetota bacterium]|nr:heme o synthase [Actinomycetota bacterium]